MSIKLTINPKIYETMKRKLPRKRVIETSLNDYFYELQKLIEASLSYENGYDPLTDTYSINKTKLYNLGGYATSRPNVRMDTWINQNCPIYKVITIGTASSKKCSRLLFDSNMIKIEDLSQMVYPLEQSTQSIIKTLNEYNNMSIEEYEVMSVRQLEALSSEDDAKRLFESLYPEYQPHMDYAKFLDYNDHRELFDVLKVDVESTKTMLLWIKNKSKYNNEEKRSMVAKLTIILQICSLTRLPSLLSTKIGDTKYANFYQRKSKSAFGRTYYKSVSIHSIKSELRRGIIGDSVQYDFKSAAITYKMLIARDYLASKNINDTIANVFPSSHMYLTNKKQFVLDIKNDVFVESDTEYCTNEKYQDTILKTAFLAIGFGSRASSEMCFRDKHGNISNGAVGDCFSDGGERRRFINHPYVQQYLKEQKILDGYIVDTMTANMKKMKKNIKDVDIFLTPKGSLSPSKVVAYAYQQYETLLMNRFLELTLEPPTDIHPSMYEKVKYANTLQYEVLARIHDGVILKHSLGERRLKEILNILRVESNNPYINMSMDIFKGYNTSVGKSLDEWELQRIEEHKKIIERETARAKGYNPIFSSTADLPPEYFPNIVYNGREQYKAWKKAEAEREEKERLKAENRESTYNRIKHTIK